MRRSTAWRGLMLDSARHFQSPAFIRSMIEWMAWHKLNVLHWHLTDDQGWRIEIRKYPRLTSVGAWRIEPDGARYGGFYTQDEVRDIVRFAAARHVQIVPEIDMPGHATAAIAAYPALGAAIQRPGSEPLRVSANWGVLTHLFNLEPQTFRFLDDVLAEVIELFPSPVIHIGGDEVVKDEWNASPEVQARAAAARDSRPRCDCRPTSRRGSPATCANMAGGSSAGMKSCSRICRRMPSSCPGTEFPERTQRRQRATTPCWRRIRQLYFDHRQSTLPTEPPGPPPVSSRSRTCTASNRTIPRSTTRTRIMCSASRPICGPNTCKPRSACNGWRCRERRRSPKWAGRRRRVVAGRIFCERLVPMMARYRAFGLTYADSVFAPAAQISRISGGFSPGACRIRRTPDAAVERHSLHPRRRANPPSNRRAMRRR